MKLLVIEDEKKVADFLAKGLREHRFLVDTAYDGKTGEQLALRGKYDLIIVDIILPDVNGCEVVSSLRGHAIDSKVLFLTALDKVENIIFGLNCGGDDYLTKPFDFDELVARIHALLRRGNYDAHDILTAHDLVMNRTSQIVSRAGNQIDLTYREYLLLECLLIRKNEIVPRTLIARYVWNIGFETGTNVIDVYINYIRRKIDHGYSVKLIHTVRGRGFTLREES